MTRSKRKRLLRWSRIAHVGLRVERWGRRPTGRLGAVTRVDADGPRDGWTIDVRHDDGNTSVAGWWIATCDWRPA